MDDKNSDNLIQDGDYFVRQLMIHRKRIYSFILSLVANSSDADDIMQETAVLMWKKYQETADISSYAAWGIRIAHYKVLEFRRKHRNKKIQFNSDLFESILVGAVEVNEGLDRRHEALKKCISKLKPQQKKIIELRHQKGQTVKSIAELLHLSPHNVYKLIPRIHDMLVRCIHRTLRTEGLV